MLPEQPSLAQATPARRKNRQITWCLNLVAAPRQMPQARWQCLNFSGTGHDTLVSLRGKDSSV